MGRFSRPPRRRAFAFALSLAIALGAQASVGALAEDVTAAPDPPGRDLVFALDASGSMHDAKFDVVKVAFREMTAPLRPNDRLTVFTFSAPKDWWKDFWSEQLEPATAENLAAAAAFVDGSGTSGSSNIVSALQLAFARFASPASREPIVVLVSDGIASNGPIDQDDVLAAVEKANNGRACVFTVAVGEDANTGLLGELAGAHGGSFSRAENAAEAADGFQCALPRSVVPGDPLPVVSDELRPVVADANPAPPVDGVSQESVVILFPEWSAPPPGTVASVMTEQPSALQPVAPLALLGMFLAASAGAALGTARRRG